MGYRLLGAHLNTTVNQLPETIQRWKPPLVVLLDHSDVWHEVKAESPKTVFVGRVFHEYEPDFNDPLLDPIDAARDHCDRILPWAERMGETYDYWQGVNEPILASTDAMIRCATFDAERARIMAEHGFRVIVGSFSVGNPKLPLWREFLPALEAAHQYEGALALHEYAWPTLDRNWPWHLLRHRKVYGGEPTHDWEGFPEHLKALPLLITECGLDGLLERSDRPKGWKALYGSDTSKYQQQLSWYDRQLQRDPYVVGAALYCMSTPDPVWSTYDHWPEMARILAKEAEPIYRLSDPQPPTPPDWPPDESEISGASGPILAEQVVWEMGVEYRAGARIVAGALPQVGVEVEVADPWGNASTVVSGSKPEHGLGGFEVLAAHAGPYRVSFLGQMFEVKAEERTTFVTFKRERKAPPPRPPEPPTPPEEPVPVEPLPPLPAEEGARLKLALGQMDRIIHLLRLRLYGNIGSAAMEANGTVVLLFGRGQGADLDLESVVTYRPEDPRYSAILAHVGGLEPGQLKPVPPWPDEGTGVL